MRNLFKMIAVLASLVGFASASTPVEVMVPIDQIYSPNGFDSNDNAEIIVEGYLPNLCHKSPKSEVVVKGNVIDIKMKSLKYESDNPFCPEMIVPFIEAVDVGVLDKGVYDIRVNGKSIYAKESVISVDEASSDAVDEFVYANVEYVAKKEGSRVVELKGYNPSDCFVLDEIQVVDNGKDVYSILPKMKQIYDICPMKMVPFSFEVEVPSKLKSDKVLLHVRSMDGKSVNSLFFNGQNM
ncbi:hypothetical protein OAT67_08030 [Bacteriovoracaceae bacterium]|nr:hypothetical protein [Bacteriovoracaceae bacterium]